MCLANLILRQSFSVKNVGSRRNSELYGFYFYSDDIRSINILNNLCTQKPRVKNNTIFLFNFCYISLVSRIVLSQILRKYKCRLLFNQFPVARMNVIKHWITGSDMSENISFRTFRTFDISITLRYVHEG
jgi:hypothetical protein